ncbi:hypothetical protein D9M71_675500 [compost metagenome]
MFPVIDQPQAKRRVTDLPGQPANGVEQGANLHRRGLGRHDDQGLGKVGHAAEREAAAGEGTQVGHGDVVVVTGQVDGRVVVDRRTHIHRQRGLAAIALGAAQGAGKAEVEAQAVTVANLQRRHQRVLG